MGEQLVWVGYLGQRTGTAAGASQIAGKRVGPGSRAFTKESSMLLLMA